MGSGSEDQRRKGEGSCECFAIVVMLETDLRFHRGFVWTFVLYDCPCNVDLLQADLWGSLVTRDLGNTGLGWLLLKRLVLKHSLVDFIRGFITSGRHIHSRTTIKIASKKFSVRLFGGQSN